MAKVLDDVLFALVNIQTFKGNRKSASIIRVMNMFVFFSVVSKVQSDNLPMIGVIGLASGVGRYLSFLIDDLLTKDKEWHVNVHFKEDKEKLQPAIDKLREAGIDVLSKKTHHSDSSSSLSLEIVSDSKETSKLIREKLPDSAKIGFLEMKEYY